MRLASLILACVLGTILQAAPEAPARELPWSLTYQPSWQPCDSAAEPQPIPVPELPRKDGMKVLLTTFGVLQIEDIRGIIRLRMGLPGRPLKIWRGAGVPMTLEDFPCRFPSETPLSKGSPAGDRDFRTSLAGLLWVLDDSEHMITVVHPATLQVVFIPLPGQNGLDLKWYPDRLQVRESLTGPVGRRDLGCWSVPWAGLLPQFLHLTSQPPPLPQGTALVPFPVE